jgi:hypothetical protein
MAKGWSLLVAHSGKTTIYSCGETTAPSHSPQSRSCCRSLRGHPPSAPTMLRGIAMPMDDAFPPSLCFLTHLFLPVPVALFAPQFCSGPLLDLSLFISAGPESPKKRRGTLASGNNQHCYLARIARKGGWDIRKHKVLMISEFFFHIFFFSTQEIY